jgi:hypothetical protein
MLGTKRVVIIATANVTEEINSCTVDGKFYVNKVENRLRVFKKMVLWRIFGPKGDEVTRGCIKLHNEELHNLYSSPNIIR